MRNLTARRRLRVSVITLFFVAAGCLAHGQNASRDGSSTHGKQSIQAVRTELAVVVDGSLDEPAWQEASISLGFIQKDPHEGEASTEKTEFRVLYTATTLYIGVLCYDSNPHGILATERRRDNRLDNDDTISLVLDTFHDHRNSYLFRTNPLGAQYDALVTDEGNNVNPDWDERWEVAAQIIPAGWMAEFAIPFKSLRVQESEDGMVWGLDLERVIRRKNEFSYWNGYRRGFTLENVSQAGHLRGLEEIQTGLRLRIKPYLLSGFSHTSDRSRSTLCRPSEGPGGTSSGSAFCNASDFGMEVMKYRVTPSLTLDLTWKTDFAQTEIDDQQVNLDRFPLFFPEKREFFQEGAGIFEFGIASGENQGGIPETKLYHTRQIGLSPKRQPVPIVGGARITGKLHGLTLGLLNVQTEAFAPENLAPSNYGVVRVKRDILARSNIGGFVLSREQGGTSDYNRVYGADANFVFFKYFAVGGFLAKSSSPGAEQDNWASAATIRWDSDFFNLQTSWLAVDPKFRDDLGFVPRPNMRQISPQIALRPRPRNHRFIRQFVFRHRMDYTMNQQNELETRITHHRFEIKFQDGTSVVWAPHTRFERLRDPFAIRPGVVIPAGTHFWWYSPFQFFSNPAKRLSAAASWFPHFGYWNGGSLHTVSLSPRLKLSEQASVEVEYQFNKASLPSTTCVGNSGNSPCGFTDHVINTRLNYNFNNQWLTSTMIQYSNTDNFFGFNFRLNYIFRPGDDFFLIYNEGRRVGGALDGQKDRTLQTKLTYSFDF